MVKKQYNRRYGGIDQAPLCWLTCPAALARGTLISMTIDQAPLLLAHFDMTPERGFLTPYDMGEVTLPTPCQPIVEAGRQLSGYLLSGRVRHFLNALPPVDMPTLLPGLCDAQKRLLMVHYSFIVQAYVWGEATPPLHLPQNLAVPYCQLADALGMFPLLPYSAYTLDNWSKLEPEGPVTLDNIRVLQHFLDGADENWFIMVHIEIEAKAGAALAAIPELLTAVDANDRERVSHQLHTILQAWQQINPVFDRMPERCDPYVYYLRVRPYIHGWKGNPALPNGLVYEGVERFGGQPQAFRGQTGSQSSIVPTMDALLNIDHQDDPLRQYLDELHAYRPVGHRRFIEAVQQRSALRRFVQQHADPELTDWYNGCVQAVYQFRSRHLEYAASYIHKQARNAEGNPVDVGTGGTPFMEYLKKHRDESERHLLRL